MNRFYQHPLSPAWTTARARAALVKPLPMSKGPVAMTLHKSVDAIHGPAIEDLQAYSVPFRAMTAPLSAPSKAIPSRSPFATLLASPFGSIERITYHSRSIAMIALHKPERATYGQAVEAQLEFGRIVCTTNPPKADCDLEGSLCCCC